MNKVIKTVVFAFLALGLVAGCGFTSSSKQKGENAAGGGGTVIEITEDEFAELVYDFKNGGEWNYKGDKPAVIDFYAVWCGPCKRLRPRLEQLAHEYGDEIVVYSIDAEKALTISSMIGLRAFPTLLFVPVEGTPTLGEGLMSLKALREEVEKIKD
ncbi:MAG: thioredoxin domain-containing protein [Porphyromonas sp.]|nr:thioredoxin domain-containing protein [Porphyromonas sp.]